MDPTPPADAPTPAQLQFARGVYIVLALWPALRQAVTEQWGGPESDEKRTFLLSHLCDEYGDRGAATKPDMDDVADLLEAYMADEFDCQLEDDSAILVAQHVCLLHAGVFEEQRGAAMLHELEASFAKVQSRPAKSAVQDDTALGGDADMSGEDDAPSTAPPAPPAAPAPRAEPRIDEDGFELVQPRRRR